MKVALRIAWPAVFAVIVGCGIAAAQQPPDDGTHLGVAGCA